MSIETITDLQSSFRAEYYSLPPSKRKLMPIKQEYVDLFGVVIGIAKLIATSNNDGELKGRIDDLFVYLGDEALDNASEALAMLAAEDTAIKLAKRLSADDSGRNILRRAFGVSIGGALVEALRGDIAFLAVFVDNVTCGIMPVIVAWQNTLEVLSPEVRRQFAMKAPLPVDLLQSTIRFKNAFSTEVISNLPNDMVDAATEQIHILDTDRYLPDSESINRYLNEDAEERVSVINDKLLKKLKGAATALKLSEDGVSQAANSLIELIDRMLRDFASKQEVSAWLHENGFPDNRDDLYDSKTKKPTKLAECLCFLYGGGLLPSKFNDSEGSELLETFYFYLAKSLAAARKNLQQIKHADRGSQEERESIKQSTDAILGVIEIAHRFCWVFKGDLPGCFKPVAD